MFKAAVIVCLVAAASAMPAEDPVLMKLADGPRFQYEDADNDLQQLHLVDTWVTLSDLAGRGSRRFDALRTTEFHLFTRENPGRSQPLVLNNADTVRNSNFNPGRRTAVLIHGFLGSATSGCNRALVPAYLAGYDVNVIVVNWEAGNSNGHNAAPVALVTATFIDWLNELTGATPSQYHVVGFSVGGHGAGIVGRHVTGTIDYITGLDPSSRWRTTETHFLPTDGKYTEVIHTNAGVSGWRDPLAQVDWYPNGGRDQPGCGIIIGNVCDHNRSWEFMAESLRRGGFTGRRCGSLAHAQLGNCHLEGTLNMGGATPKHGATGIWGLRTNRWAPFSMG